MSLELVFPDCPTCDRKLKPSEYNQLVCRYCNISVSIHYMKSYKKPEEFLSKYKKTPKGTKINEELKERNRLLSEHEENMKNYPHFPVPEKCPECDSKAIVASYGDHAWECLDCEDYFTWYRYRVIYHGDCEVDARDKDMAVDLAYEVMEEADIEAEVDRI